MSRASSTAKTDLVLERNVFANVKIYRAGRYFILALSDRIYVIDADYVRTIKKRKFVRIEGVLRRKGVIA